MYLLSISIGPVQDFIATARRSRDLWFGSWLLSELSKAAAKYIHEHNGSLIFPSPKDPAADLEEDSTFSVANKLVATVETNDVAAFCDAISAAMTARLSAIKKDSFNDLKTLKIRWTEADEQVNDLTEFYWAAVAFDGSVTSYQAARNKAEALLAARKVTRNFRPVAWGAHVPKSSLDGLRESVIEEAIFDSLDRRDLTAQQRVETEKQLRTRYGVRGKERLCGVALLKRHGKPKKNKSGIDNFFSSSHVAALPLLKRLKDKTKVKDYLVELTKPDLLNLIDDKEIRAYLGHVPRNASLKPHQYFCNHDGSVLYDGHLLFKERLREFFPDEARRKRGQEALVKFLRTALGTAKDPNPSPHPYYAILHADGDRMGAVIDYQASTGQTRHNDLSLALSKFADHVKQVVEVTHEGSCIYAGGDDVLALLPLHTALDCARDLANEFAGALNKFKDDKNNSPTLSVGLAIGHHLDPLQETLALARDAEKVAKKEVPNRKNPEKNALAVTLSKRSGSERTVKGSWNNDKQNALDSRLNRFIFLLLRDELPDGAAYELRDLAMRLKPWKGASDTERIHLRAAQQAEAKRILRRKQPKHGKKPKVATKILDEFCGVKSENNGQYVPGFIDLIDLENWTLKDLANEIIIAREFARAIEQADNMQEFATKHGFVGMDEESNYGA